MRLSAAAIDAIRSASRDVVGPPALVRLFGSRLDDAAAATAANALRNRPVRDYPTAPERRAARINDAWGLAPALLDEPDAADGYAARHAPDGEKR